MAVLINSGPVSATQRLEEVPQASWRELVAARRHFCAVHLPYDCRELLHFVEEAPEMLEVLGYKDATDFLRRGLELDPNLVQWAVQGLRRLKPDDAIPFARAVAMGRHGGDRKSATAKQSTLSDKVDYGTSASYYLARLERDGLAGDKYKANLAWRIRRGEVKPKTAARLAGIVKTRTPLQHLRAWWKKASAEEQAEFRKDIA